MPWRRDRVLVGSVDVAEPGTAAVARYLRDAGQEVIVTPDYADPDSGAAALVRAAVQEDVAAVDITVSPRTEPRVTAALADGLAAYDAADVLVDAHYRVEDSARDAWTELDAVGATNGQLLADAGYTPDDASFKDIWSVLREGYVARLEDDARGEQVGRGQAKNIYSANRDRYGDEPVPGKQSSLAWWADG